MKLAVVFPGIGYHVDKPLLYYSKKIAEEQGYQVIDLPYGGFPQNVKGSPKKMEEVFRSALSQSDRILDGIHFEEYEDILFLSKSVGTAVAAAFAQNHGLRTRNIFYTPVGESFSFITQPGIVFHGTKDGWVETAVVKKECANRKLPLYITKEGNHSLETGCAKKDLEHLMKIMEISAAYIAGNEPML